MTVEIPVPEGPACDFCTEWPAVGSLMNLAGYTTQKFCASCGPKFLLNIVEAMTGTDLAETPDPTQGPDAAEPNMTTDAASSQSPDTPDDDDEPGSAADHWASTKHVVRSTHGHRKTPGASGQPDREDTP